MSSIKNIKTNVLGYPRIGKKRELKKACEAYWAGKINRNELENTARNLRRENWNLLQKAGIDLIPSNDFSYYDTTLDLTLTLGAIPSRSNSLKEDKLRLYFAMAHGEQNEQETGEEQACHGQCRTPAGAITGRPVCARATGRRSRRASRFLFGPGTGGNWCSAGRAAFPGSGGPCSP